MRFCFLFLAAFLLSSCSEHYDQVVELEVDDIIVRVSLKQSAPASPDYQRLLEVAQAGSVDEKKIPSARAGSAWVAVIDNRGTLEIKDATGLQYSRPLGANAAKDRRYLGRFDFNAAKVYRFITAIEDPKEP